MLPAAYARLPGTAQPRYTLDRAEETLRHFAKRMNQQGTRDLAWWRIPDWTAPATPRILIGLAGGLVVGLMFGLGLVGGLAVGLMFGLVVGLPIFELRGHAPRTMGPLRWGTLISGNTVVIGLGLVLGVVFGLMFGLVVGLGLVGKLVFGLVFGLGFGLTYVLQTATWATALACAQSSFTHGTPLRMIRFLEDARARNVLRTVGPVYQFRHARLQDRLADRTMAQATAYRTPHAKPRGI